jgi:hypothetical protein
LGTERIVRCLAAGLLSAAVAAAQENYEIQVYPSETADPGTTFLEFHSNFTIEGSKQKEGALLPTHHTFHETLEITRGWTDWFETGFYTFTSAAKGQGWMWVGQHIRPRVRVPPAWKWPVGVGLSLEFGYQRPAFSPDTWTLEIRPIVDRQFGRFYTAFNPTVGRSFHGPSVSSGLDFSPNVKLAWNFTRRISGGLEYYGALGPITGFDPLRDQQHLILPAIDLDLGPNWEFNFGAGIGVTRGTDHLIVKMIFGRRFGFRQRSADSTGPPGP